MNRIIIMIMVISVIVTIFFLEPLLPSTGMVIENVATEVTPDIKMVDIDYIFVENNIIKFVNITKKIQ